jgi:ABC-type multidrug transport system permease subunit
MKNFGDLFRIRLKVRFRELDFVFITFALPILIIVMNSIVSQRGIELFLPGGIVMVISIPSLLGCLSSIVSDKSRGMLKMMRIIPGSPVIYLLSEVLITLVFIAASTGILMGVSWALGAETVKFDVLFFMATVLLGSFALMSFALIIAGFVNNEKIANALTSVLGSALVILSFPPQDVFPSVSKLFIYVLPTVPLSDILRQTLLGVTSNVDISINMMILIVWITIAIAVTKVFRWK